MTAHPDLALAAVEGRAVTAAAVERHCDAVCAWPQAVAVALAVLEAAVAGGHVVTLQAHRDAVEKAGAA